MEALDIVLLVRYIHVVVRHVIGHTGWQWQKSATIKICSRDHLTPSHDINKMASHRQLFAMFTHLFIFVCLTRLFVVTTAVCIFKLAF